MFVWPSELRISRDTSLIMPRNYNFGYFYFGYFYFGQVFLFWQGISILAISILAIIILAIFRVIFSSSNYLFCWYNRGLQLLRNLLFSSTYKEVSLLFMYYLFKCLFFFIRSPWAMTSVKLQLKANWLCLVLPNSPKRLKIKRPESTHHGKLLPK